MKISEYYLNRLSYLKNESDIIVLIDEIKSEAYKEGVKAALKIHIETPPSEHWEATQEIKKLIE